jgi:hypothetical protein
MGRLGGGAFLDFNFSLRKRTVGLSSTAALPQASMSERPIAAPAFKQEGSLCPPQPREARAAGWNSLRISHQKSPGDARAF